MFKNIKKGFTIVELIIVIAVIAILAGVLIPTFSSVTANAKKSAAQQQAKNALEATLVLVGGSYTEGTDFLVTDSADGKLDYWFSYKGQALGDGDKTLAEYETGYYACYFSKECFDVKNGTNIDINEKNNEAFAQSMKLLINALKESGNVTCGYPDGITASQDSDYYTVTLSYTVGETTNSKTVRLYFTSDIKPTTVIVMGENK